MTEIVEKVGRYLKVRYDPGQHILIAEERDGGGQFSMTLEEAEALGKFAAKMRRRFRIPGGTL